MRVEFGFGAAGIGNLYRAISDDQALSCLQVAENVGLTYWDTAPFYGHGLSEWRIGRFLSENPRSKPKLSTKVGRLLDPAKDGVVEDHGFANPLPNNPRFDYTFDGVMRSFEASLKRLNADHIHTVFFHDLGQLTHGNDHGRHMRDAMTGGFRALSELKRQSVVSEIGIGANETPVLSEAMQVHPFDCFLLAGRYTLFEHEQSLDFMDACTERSVSIIIGGPYNSGLLAKPPESTSNYDYKPAPEPVRHRAARFWQICKRHNIPASAAALQFVTGHPAVTSVLTGAQTVAHVETIAANRDLSIPSGLWTELVETGLISAHAPVPTPAVTT